jgi:hypothetical protein
MNTTEIEKLLDKYYEGLTSLEEEMLLQQFFQSENIPSHFLIHAGHFQYFKEASSEEISDPLFEQKLFERINEIPVITLKQNRNRFYYISGIAAGVLLMIGLIFMLKDNLSYNNKNEKSEITNPELAFTQTCDILALVSVNFNKGIDKMQYLGQFEKAMQKTQVLSKFYQYETLIINPESYSGNSIISDKQ